MKNAHITLSHGSGGIESNALIENVFYKILGEVMCEHGEDAGVFSGAKNYAISTDSYVVSPIFFPGGDIGKLCVCGSSNDVSMRGGKPLYLTLGLIIEEGFSIEMLERILYSIRDEALNGRLKILSGDTKIVPKGNADGIYINTTAIGEMASGIDWSVKHIQEGDDIILSSSIGTHGAVIFCSRHQLALDNDLRSDCTQLYPLVESIRTCEIHSMRDATRGGLAAVLNEWSRSTNMNIEINMQCIPILQQVRGVCEILGLEAVNLANEGVFVMATPSSESEKILKILRKHPLGKDACVIGRVLSKAVGDKQAKVVSINAWGGRCYVEYPQGELLPRIC